METVPDPFFHTVNGVSNNKKNIFFKVGWGLGCRLDGGQNSGLNVSLQTIVRNGWGLIRLNRLRKNFIGRLF